MGGGGGGGGGGVEEDMGEWGMTVYTEAQDQGNSSFSRTHADTFSQ